MIQVALEEQHPEPLQLAVQPLPLGSLVRGSLLPQSPGPHQVFPLSRGYRKVLSDELPELIFD